jgi:uncharacterized protein
MEKKIMLVFVVAIIAGVLSLGLLGCSTASGANLAQTQQQGISVSGEGKVTVTPNIATLDLGVTAQAATVVAAQSQVTTAMNQVISALTSNGVAQKDIKTQNYTIQQITTPVFPPVTVTPQTGNSSSGTSTSGTIITPILPPTPTTTTKTPPITPIMPPITIIPRQVTMYEVTNTIIVTIRTIDNTGSIIDSAASAGGNLVRINSVSLSVDQPDQYYTQARQLAMDDASNKASQLAKLAGVTLGKATYISENSSSLIFPPIFNAAGVAVSGTTSISPGETSVTIDVQVVYAIK